MEAKRRVEAAFHPFPCRRSVAPGYRAVLNPAGSLAAIPTASRPPTVSSCLRQSGGWCGGSGEDPSVAGRCGRSLRLPLLLPAAVVYSDYCHREAQRGDPAGWLRRFAPRPDPPTINREGLAPTPPGSRPGKIRPAGSFRKSPTINCRPPREDGSGEQNPPEVGGEGRPEAGGVLTDRVRARCRRAGRGRSCDRRSVIFALEVAELGVADPRTGERVPPAHRDRGRLPRDGVGHRARRQEGQAVWAAVKTRRPLQVGLLVARHAGQRPKGAVVVIGL